MRHNIISVSFVVVLVSTKHSDGFVARCPPLHQMESSTSVSSEKFGIQGHHLRSVASDNNNDGNDIQDFGDPSTTSFTGDDQSTAPSTSKQKRSRRKRTSLPSSSPPTSEVTNISDLNQQIKQFRNKRRNTTQKSSSKKTRGRKMPTGQGDMDDDMAEWRELQRQIEREEQLLQQDLANMPLPSIIDELREKRQEETIILETLSSPGGGTLIDADGTPLSGGTRYDEVNLPPGAIPSQYQKKYISDFEITDDGGVYLQPEAYQQACESAANPDGSLNLKASSQDGMNVVSDVGSIFSPSVLEAVTARPMAPYGKQKTNRSSKNDITVDDLSKQARKAKKYLEKNPDAQEELHRRIMAEEEAYSSNDPSSKLFEEAFKDPEKARQFWNQEYYATRRQQTEALEKLLDERLQWFQEMSAQHLSNENQNRLEDDDTTQTSASTQNQVSSKKKSNDSLESTSIPIIERNEFVKSVEQDRLRHARNVARYYENQSNDWDGVLEDEIPIFDDEPNVDGNIQREDDDGDAADTTNSVEQGEWILMEGASSSDDPFYWNTVTEEMRWDPPTN
ncbi:hypothetical protein IV203_012440 [Nitzschia inconspicua]|uniref:WW domain-containing protein n=1 Tax=Nitzschia inconspicua TaxID=303405 RepID=A0A9K3PJT1_9STRA|nr:hypothetical protein IV203_012440 [Nitzschia inconspicua]